MKLHMQLWRVISIFHAPALVISTATMETGVVVDVAIVEIDVPRRRRITRTREKMTGTRLRAASKKES